MSRVPDGGAAFFTLLRRAGTHAGHALVSPGSAAHQAEARRAAQHPGHGCGRKKPSFVIASEAKQSSLQRKERSWIALSLRSSQ
jgi:hypothetical protein